MSNLLRLAALVIPAALAGPAPARAVTTTTIVSTFDFSGTCADCAGTATGQLMLANYTFGDAIAATNFISFSYGGTDLVAPFTIAATQASGLGGSMNPPFPAAEDFSVIGNNEDFTSQTNGFWCVGGACFADYGLDHGWTLVQTTTQPADPAGTTTIPEPSSLALLGGGLLGLAVLRRRT